MLGKVGVEREDDGCEREWGIEEEDAVRGIVEGQEEVVGEEATSTSFFEVMLWI